MADLRELVAAELGLPVDPRVTAVASAIAAKHGAGSSAVLFYGSCLREKKLEGKDRQAFVNDCLKAKPEKKESKIAMCNKQTAGLKGDERKKAQSECMKGA